MAAPRPGWPRARGHGSLHKDMESSRDNARGIGPSPGEIRTIPADLSQLKTCHGHFHHTIYTLFKRKSLFKPKSQEASFPECQSRLVAPHQEPFVHPSFKITPVRHEPLRVRGCPPAWVAASQGVWFQGRGHGSLHKDMESSRDNARGNILSPG